MSSKKSGCVVINFRLFASKKTLSTVVNGWQNDKILIIFFIQPLLNLRPFIGYNLKLIPKNWMFHIILSLFHFQLWWQAHKMVIIFPIAKLVRVIGLHTLRWRQWNIMVCRIRFANAKTQQAVLRKLQLFINWCRSISTLLLTQFD